MEELFYGCSQGTSLMKHDQQCVRMALLYKIYKNIICHVYHVYRLIWDTHTVFEDFQTVCSHAWQQQWICTGLIIVFIEY